MVLAEFVESVTEMPGLFADVASVDPIAALLLAVGSLLVGLSMGVFGVLVLGAAVEFVTPDRTAKSHP